MKSKSLILLVLSIGFGIVAAIGISQVMKGQAIGKETATPMGPVLVAADTLDLKTQLTEENVKIENWPTSIIPPDAISSLDEIVDMVTTSRMSEGMPVVRGLITHKNTAQNHTIPPNMKVVAVRVSADDTIGNLLNPGDKVDVIGVFKQRDQTTNQTTTSSRTFLKALRVYSIGNKTQVDNTESASSSNATSIVGLLVNEKQSEALVFVQDTGSIKLVLRGDNEENNGEVGDLQELKDELLASENSVQETPKPKKVSNQVMQVFRGNDVSRIKFDNSGARVQEGEMGKESGGSGSRESKEDDYTDSRDRGDSDRGIDDDQYRGE